MTTDCFDNIHLDVQDEPKTRASFAEIGAAVITAVGFVLLLPTASLILSLLQH
jgi:hypothetical protein